MVVKSIKTKTVCVSHEEDADGISSAALIKHGWETAVLRFADTSVFSTKKRKSFPKQPALI